MNASAQLSFPVVIIGAGPTGVTAATLLAQHGVQCLLLERWATVYPQPRAVHLDDEIYRILAQLGIAEQFATISRPGAGMRLLDHRGQILSQIARAPIGTHGYPQANMFDQPELEQLLRANLTNYPQVSLRGGVEVTTIAHISASQVQVTFTDRDSGDEHKVTATYVLGCDGANSVVRAAIGASMTARRFAQRWLVVDLNTDADLGHWDGVHHLCDPDRATTFMRVGERRYRWEFKLHPGETAADYDTVEKLRPLIAVWTGASAISELTLIRVTEYTFRAHVASHWRDRNVFILGDAAHLTPPFVGQGMGAGIRDAANLTWKLAGVLDGQLPTHVLDTYEQERKPHAWKMITIALAVGAAMTARGTAATAIRNLLVPRLQYIPGLRSRIQHSGTPALTRSALVNKTPRCRQLAGTQIPNLVLSQGHRIDTLLGSGFALVASETVDADQQAQLRRRGAAIIVEPRGSELDRWLRRGGARAALIRPDRTVMQTARSPSQIAFTTTLFAPTHQPAPTYRETP
ncbi:bifunctional 3-(3-hydroxy-phenyl)propionate/3-hydroxycinnamic acid hydroxylase [Mycobacteroides abscessus]|uniref:Bifunctional 3-(3-hydroxy-phenyl)propionate/3-hydroxycinnamic acid hydroxylase n=3 Tax=Mycobacteroides abscessus TaxID=36809 RepID=A0ABD7HJB5_9MYCO|nr:bifunctional 3-(3-hydroxy-phenyl)propionate/3-hydroxycinnamic acid hydroxylase [Mycobacteroides abscessus]AWG65105.1 bifunctional 3-(3-hydroxy-phenyl)propionate/3-hydroxycinnamic acid hydroxylase [Mycobacteroides abscessus]MBN7434582.1 bifunctional 3-(3-hydroxy-phenyl)propionate/3-hydroxycinnamic acid hydroxylase [Mycobacteroides abscessus subsp. abscessus]MDM1886418.1 bifunctional 3-(3-hydroxy-phenyl)propionate/3-hydroxycinnamic acid hydroxylase [Mycobacteroides abscessus]MDM1889750.1 bifun